MKASQGKNRQQGQDSSICQTPQTNIRQDEGTGIGQPSEREEELMEEEEEEEE